MQLKEFGIGFSRISASSFPVNGGSYKRPRCTMNVNRGATALPLKNKRAFTARGLIFFGRTVKRKSHQYSTCITLHSFRLKTIHTSSTQDRSHTIHHRKGKRKCYPTFSALFSASPSSSSPTHQAPASLPYPRDQHFNPPTHATPSCLQKMTPSTAPPASAPHPTGPWTRPTAPTTGSATIAPTSTVPSPLNQPADPAAPLTSKTITTPITDLSFKTNVYALMLMIQ